ncbi:MAG TPA: hypothetical protein PLQ44_02700 [Candidatus Paceibacterota bacterium]|nr:hypothetical protein [Candidatus Paceibacterota bacterium]HPT40489.1 hypothetical protein [Candidatus Paceibacterota bacterium]
MSRVKFEYNLDKDKENVLRVINNPPVFDPDNLKRPLGKLPEELVNETKKETDVLKRGIIVEKFLKDNFNNKKDLIDQRIKQFQEMWDKIDGEYFKRLEDILNKKMPSDVVYIGYLTSAGSCPFDPRSRTFMVRMDDEKVDVVAGHEIMHIEFIRNFGFYCRDVLKLTPKDFGRFQEASTFLLNDEMKDLFSRPDYGYKEHQDLRAKLSEEWGKHKDFNKLLDYYKIYIEGVKSGT